MAMHYARMFTVKEINRLKILQDVIDRNLRPGQAAEMLGITPRHCTRLLKRYRQSGPLGMNNQSRGCTGNRQLPASLTELALNIIRERYPDFGPTLAREKLAEYHGIVLGKETLRRLMIKTALWVHRKQFRSHAIAGLAAANLYRLMVATITGSRTVRPPVLLWSTLMMRLVDNKRLGRILESIKLVQDERNNNRSQELPAGDGSSRRRRKPTEKKSQCSLNSDDMLEALKTLQSCSEEIFGKRK